MTNQLFDQTLYTSVLFEGTLQRGQPTSATEWGVIANVYDRTTSALLPDAGMTAGPPGQLVPVLPVVQGGTSYRAINAFQGPQTTFVANIEYGQAWMRGARVTCPSIHSYTWTRTDLPNGEERHVVSWAPANEPGVVVSFVGDIEMQLNKSDTGTYEWTQSTRPGQRNVQLVRRIDVSVPPRSALQCFVRVRTTL